MFYLTTHSLHLFTASNIWLKTILIGYSFRLAARVLLYAPSDRQSWSTGWNEREREREREREGGGVHCTYIRLLIIIHVYNSSNNHCYNGHGMVRSGQSV